VKVIATLDVQPVVEGPVTVRVSIQDVSLADASSITVAETAVAADPSSLAGPYELEADLEPGRQYAVYVHVDRSGDGTLVSGDLINSVRVPLPTTTSEDEVHVEVPVHEID
jgi:uncharacterized lipoprotein YbaY